MLRVTDTEFKLNFFEYLALVGDEEIRVTRDGIEIAVISAPSHQSHESVVDSSVGVIPNDNLDRNNARDERLSRV